MAGDETLGGPDVPDDAPGELIIDLYHRTSVENADRIRRTAVMVSEENTGEAYFSTRPDGYGAGYGPGIVHIRVPLSLAALDDEFSDGEQHYRVLCAALVPEHFVTTDL